MDLSELIRQELLKDLLDENLGERLDVDTEDILTARCLFHNLNEHQIPSATSCLLHADKKYDIITSSDKMNDLAKTETLAEFCEDALCIPPILCVFIDYIFMSLPSKEAKKFALNCFKAMKVGSDLSVVHARFVQWALINPSIRGNNHIFTDVGAKKTAKIIGDLLEKQINGEEIGDKEIDSIRVRIREIGAGKDDQDLQRYRYNKQTLSAILYLFDSSDDYKLTKAARFVLYSIKNFTEEHYLDLEVEENIKSHYANQLTELIHKAG